MATANIPIFDIVGGALSRVFGGLGQVFSVGMLPMILYFVISAVGTYLTIGTQNTLVNLVIAILNALVVGFFIIAWHRVMLEGYKGAASKAKFEFGPREQKFFGFYAMFAVAAFVLVFVCGLLVAATGTLGYIISIVAALAAIYVFTRLQLVFPASAIGEPASVEIAWRESAGAFWQMFAINVVLFVVLVLAAIVVGIIIGIIVAAVAALGSVLILVIVASALGTILYFVVVAVFVSALSLVYRKVAPGPMPA